MKKYLEGSFDYLQISTVVFMCLNLLFLVYENTAWKYQILLLRLFLFMAFRSKKIHHMNI